MVDEMRTAVRAVLARHNLDDETLFEDVCRVLMFSRSQFAVEIWANAENPGDATSFEPRVVDLLGSRREGASDYEALARVVKLAAALTNELRGLSEWRVRMLEQLAPNKLDELLPAVVRLRASAEAAMADMGAPSREPGEGRPVTVEGEESLAIFEILWRHGIENLRRCSRIVADIQKDTGRSANDVQSLAETLYQRFRNARGK